MSEVEKRPPEPTFVQMVITPNNATWQGSLLALDSTGTVWMMDNHSRWKWFAGTDGPGISNPAPSADEAKP